MGFAERCDFLRRLLNCEQTAFTDFVIHHGGRLPIARLFTRRRGFKLVC